MSYLILKYLALVIIFMNVFFVNTYADIENDKEIIKVGIYEYAPYYSIDSDGNVTGYYRDLLNLIERNSNFEFEYILYDFADALNELQQGDKIDIILGLAITPERTDKVLFNTYRVGLEKHSLITNQHLPIGNLYNLNGLQLGLVEGAANSEWILNLLNSKNINPTPVYAKNFNDLEKLLEEGSIDLMLRSAHAKTNYTTIYQFTCHQVYIGARKGNLAILDKLDHIIEGFNNRKINPMVTLYDNYFNPHHKVEILKCVILSILSLVIIWLGLYFILIPKIKKFRIRNRIKVRINANHYLMHYQPIYNPKSNKIVGFEALLRLKDIRGNLIFPDKFIPEIEENDMLFDVSLWILNRVLNDYHIVNTYEIITENDFYLSINLSIKEIENDDFIDKAINLLHKSNIGMNKVCLEVTEKVKTDNLTKLNYSIKKLKDAGFKIAIDDFGIAYSNLDIIEKLDFDIIKLDKYFIDDICICPTKREIVLFISKIATLSNKSLILEGIEEKYQDMLIKSLENNNIYVQGYYYNRPMPLEKLKLIKNE